MSVSTLHLYKVNKHVIDYSNLWTGPFETMSKTYYGKIDLNYYVPLSDEFDITLNSELLRIATNKNLLSIKPPYYSKTTTNTTWEVKHDIVVGQSTMSTGSSVLRFNDIAATIGKSYTLYYEMNNIKGIDDNSTYYVEPVKVLGDGTANGVYAFLHDRTKNTYTFTATHPFIRLTLILQNNVSTNRDTYCEYRVGLFETDTYDGYEPYHSANTVNAFNNVNYAVIENEDETRHYFIKDKKQRLTKGTRQFSLSVDEWFDKGLNNGLDVLQRVGHPDTNFNLWYDTYDYIVKPKHDGLLLSSRQSTLYQSTSHKNDVAIVMIYQTPLTFYTVVKGYDQPQTLKNDFLTLSQATKIRDENNVIYDVTPIRGYIIPGAFLGTYDYRVSMFQAGTSLDFYVNEAWGEIDFARRPATNAVYSQFITETFHTSNKWENSYFGDAITKGYPIKEVLGFTGQMYDIDAPIITTLGNSSMNIKLTLSFGISEISTTIQAPFTNGKYEDVTSAFEEIVSFSEYQQFVNTNRSSLAVQRGINLFNVGMGLISISTGQGGMGLVSAVSGIASTESSVQDKKYKKCVTTGNQGGLMNYESARIYGLNGFCAHYEKCENSRNVLKTIQRYGYKFDGVMTNTLIGTSTTFETDYSDTDIKAPSDLNYKRFYRYIEGDVVSSKLIPEQIKNAFKRGVYIHYAVANS